MKKLLAIAFVASLATANFAAADDVATAPKAEMKDGMVMLNGAKAVDGQYEIDGKVVTVKDGKVAE